MPLPEFDPNASGPRGQEGISPEDIAKAQAQLGLGQRPEDAPGVEAAMSAEVERIAKEFGAPPSPAPTEDTPAPAGSAPAPQTPPPEEDLAERIRKAKSKYGNDLDQLAKAYVHTDAARTRTQQAARSELDALTQQVENLNATVAALLTPRDSGYSESAAPQAPKNGPTAPGAPEDFFQNPEPFMRRIVQETVQENLLAMEEARSRREQATRLEQLQAERAEEIERLRPVMARIYTKNRDLYDGKPVARIMEDLLDRAKTLEGATKGAQFYADIRDIDGNNPGVANPEPGPGASALGAGTGRPASGRPAPITNYSDTPGMKRLFKTRPDSQDEMAALTEVLKERGFGEKV